MAVMWVLLLPLHPAMASSPFAATCVWNETTGNWSDTSKWDCGVVPDGDDNVTISAGAVTLDASTTIASLTVSGGTLTGANILNVSGTFTFSGGTIGLSDGTSASDLIIGGTTAFSGGVRTLGPNTTLELNNKTTWSGFHTQGDAGTVIINNDTLVHQVGFPLSLVGDPIPRPRFDNQGVYQYTAASAIVVAWKFDNAGEFDVQSSTVTLGEGGTAGSLFNVADGATLTFQSGIFDLTLADFTIGGPSGLVDFGATATTDTLSGLINNAGKIRVSNGDWTFTQAAISEVFEITGGTAAFNQTTTLSRLNFNGGTIETPALMMVSVTGPTAFGGGVRTLGPNSTLELNDMTTWTGFHTQGNAGSVIINNDTLVHQVGFPLSIVGGDPVPRPRFDNQGVYQYTAASAIGVGWQFDNAGELDVQSSTVTFSYGATAASVFKVANNATLNFQTGVYDLTLADFTVAGPNGLLEFSATATTDTLSGLISNAGKVRVGGGDWTFTQASIDGVFEITGGIAAFNQNTTLSSLNWNGGTIETPVSMMVSVTGPTAFGGGNRTLAANSTLELNDMTTWTGFHTLGQAGAVIINNDTLTQQVNFTLALAPGDPMPRPRFDNQGAYLYVSDLGITSAWKFDNAGLLHVQDGSFSFGEGGTNTGLVKISAGAGSTIASSTFTNAASGTIGGEGTVSLSGGGASYTNSGTYAPGASPGTLTVSGDYANSTLEIEIDDAGGPGAGHDLLAVTGNAPLTGTLEVILDPGFTPTLHQQFKIMTCGGTCSGIFSSVVDNSPDWLFNEIVSPDSVILVATQAGLSMHVRAFLEGAYAGGSMSTTLRDNGDVPLSQPFSNAMYDGTVLDYDSVQTVGVLPDSTVDWVLVSLREGTAAGTEVPGSKFAALIFGNGTVASTGSDSLHFPVAEDGLYHLVLRSRNHLDVMSPAIVIEEGVGSWDFTTASTQAFGASPMKSLSGGVWGLFASDGNADGQATAPDFNLWNAATTAGASGYQQSDYNQDGQVTAPDFNLWNANTTAGASSKVP